MGIGAARAVRAPPPVVYATVLTPVKVRVVTEPESHLAGVVAVVTGGGRGFGRVVANHLAAAGAAVAVTGRSSEHLADAVREMADNGGTAVAVPMDVVDPKSVTVAMAEARDQLGPIQLLVNNAGVKGPLGPGWEVDEQAWWHTLEVNLRGVMLCSAAALPSMLEQGTGRIVNIVSHAGVFRWPNMSAYSVSKAAVVKLTENQAYESRKHGVKVFAVHPGQLPIGFAEDVLAMDAPEGSHEAKLVGWLRRQFSEGNVVPAERGAELVVRIGTGEVDALSGRYLRADEDVDSLIADAANITSEDRLFLRLRS